MASKSRPQLRISELPAEILSLIIAHLTQHDLKSVRRAARCFDSLSRGLLFRHMCIDPSTDSVARWRSAFTDRSLPRLVRRVTVYTHPHREPRAFNEDGFFHHPPVPIDRGFFAALNSIAYCAQLSTFDIIFSFECVGTSNPQGMVVPEDFVRRQAMLERIFTLLSVQKYEAWTPRIRSLTIKHLQNWPDETLTSRDLFRDAMDDLHELHLQIATQITEENPYHDVYLPELITFQPHLRRAWLEPVASHLRCLSLYYDQPWGLLPSNLETEGLVFPHLERLSLGNYVIGHDAQLDWVLLQPSLSFLLLHECKIVYSICLWLDSPDRSMDWAVNTEHWTDVTTAEDHGLVRRWSYRTTWASFLLKIQRDPLHLRHFIISYNDEPDALLNLPGPTDVLKNRLSASRYAMFDEGALPSRWLIMALSTDIDAYDRELSVRHQETFEQDHNALGALLADLGKRRSS